MWFTLIIVHSPLFVFTVFRTQNHDIAMAYSITENIDDIFCGNPSITSYIHGLFQYSTKWIIFVLRQMNWKILWWYPIACVFILIAVKQICIPVIAWHYSKYLDIFIIPCPTKCFCELFSLFCTSEHCLIEIKVNATTNVIFYSTIHGSWFGEFQNLCYRNISRMFL